MMTKEYCMAVSEVVCIIEQSDDSYRKKIPNKFMKFLLNNVDPDYKPEFNINTPLKDLPLRKETKGILALIYRSYICTPEERKEFDRILKENEIKNQQSLSEKYDVSKMFEERQKEIITAEKENKILSSENNTSMVTYKEESFFKKIINKIKNFFGFNKH